MEESTVPNLRTRLTEFLLLVNPRTRRGWTSTGRDTKGSHQEVGWTAGTGRHSRSGHTEGKLWNRRCFWLFLGIHYDFDTPINPRFICFCEPSPLPPPSRLSVLGVVNPWLTHPTSSSHPPFSDPTEGPGSLPCVFPFVVPHSSSPCRAGTLDGLRHSVRPGVHRYRSHRKSFCRLTLCI